MRRAITTHIRRTAGPGIETEANDFVVSKVREEGSKWYGRIRNSQQKMKIPSAPRPPDDTMAVSLPKIWCRYYVGSRLRGRGAQMRRGVEERQGMVFKSIQGFSSYMGQKTKVNCDIAVRSDGIISSLSHVMSCGASIMPRCAAVCSVSYM